MVENGVSLHDAVVSIALGVRSYSHDYHGPRQLGKLTWYTPHSPIVYVL